jgi:catechol 2,3-dioxygenase-like lactoylglutathione lyase family enzyme
MSTTTASPSIERIAQVAINVHDVPRAVRFYRDILGLKLLFEGPGMAFFDCSEVRLMLTLASRPEYDHPASIVYYAVPDLDAAHKALLARGVTFDAGPHLVGRLPAAGTKPAQECWMAFFRDSEDNVAALSAEKPVS